MHEVKNHLGHAALHDEKNDGAIDRLISRTRTASADAFAPATRRRERQAASVAALVSASAALASCGGGGSDSPGSAAAGATANGTTMATGSAGSAATTGSGATGVGTSGNPIPALTIKQAARFMMQASCGATRDDIDHLQSIGVSAWLAEQFATPRPFSLWDWMVSKGFDAAANVNSQTGIDAALWRSLISGNDTLRQRVALALSELMVIGIDGLNVSWRAFVAAAYYDLLLDNAFGNFRTLMQAVSTSVGMGAYLTFRGSTKANASTGSEPDENYARELMQLFTIGLSKLNPDGSLMMSGGASQDTYTQADIEGLARVFTGWDIAGSDNTTPARMRLPMSIVASRVETGAKTFLGTTIAAGTDNVASMKAALDTIFAHPNVGPFVGRQLIQRLVTSNPSAAYVGRVAASFANNGSGVRGDLKTVISAVLTDPEALADPTGVVTRGKIREPILRLTSWARAFNVTSPADVWAIGNTSDPGTRLGQSPLRSASVFNFFRPGYVPPDSALGNQDLVAPELQITNESSVASYLNYMQTVISNGVGDLKADVSPLLGLSSADLVSQFNLILAGGGLATDTVNSIVAAINGISTSTAAGANNRIYAAALLVMASPEYVVQK